MLHKKIFALITAAAILLAGCSAAENIPGADTDETSATVDTAEKTQTESSDVTVTAGATEGQSEDISEDTSEETDGSEPASSADETSSTSAASTAATTTKPAATTTTTKPAAATTPKPETTTPKPETTTSPKPETTTTTAKPATTTTTIPAATTTTAAPAPETGKTLYPDPADVYKILISFKEKYPEGMSWTNENRSYTSYTIYPGYAYEGHGCAAFAFELSDAAFGSQPRIEHMNVSDIKVGDILRLDNSHSVIVLEVQSGGVVIAEGNYNSSVHWGRFLSTSEIKSSLTYIWTRYK